MLFRLFSKYSKKYCDSSHNYIIGQDSKIWDWVTNPKGWSGEVEIEPDKKDLDALGLAGETSMYIIEWNTQVLDSTNKTIFEGDILEFDIKKKEHAEPQKLIGVVRYNKKLGAWHIKCQENTYLLTPALEKSMIGLPKIVGQTLITVLPHGMQL